MLLSDQVTLTVKALFKKIYLYKQCIHKLVKLYRPLNKAESSFEREQILTSIAEESQALEEEKKVLHLDILDLKKKLQETLEDKSIDFIIANSYYILTNYDGVVYSLPLEKVKGL